MARAMSGTIERRDGKPVYVRITMPDGTRARFRLPAGCSEAMAEEKRRFFLEKVASGALVPAPAAAPLESIETLGGYVTRWLAERANRKLANPTTDAYRAKLYIVDVIGAGKAVVAITSEDVRGVVEGLDEAVRADKIWWKTALNVWGLASKMFADMASSKIRVLRLRPDNPAAGVRGPDRGVQRGSAYLFPREAETLLSCAEVPVLRRVAYALAMHSGLRLGELRGLKVGDVVLTAGYVAVSRSASLGHAVKSTKGKRVRRVPIESSLRPLLASLIRDRGPEQPVLPPGLNWQDLPGNMRKDLLVAGVDRPELHASEESRRHGQTLRRPVTFHDLRHTYATWLALRGDNELVIQSRLGHSDTATTRKYIAAAEEVGQGDVGVPFGALPEVVVAVEVSTSIVHRREGTPKTSLILRTRRDSNPTAMQDCAVETGSFAANEASDAASKCPESRPVDKCLGHFRAPVEAIRVALASPLTGRLRRLTAAANDVVMAWDRGAA